MNRSVRRPAPRRVRHDPGAVRRHMIDKTPRTMSAPLRMVVASCVAVWVSAASGCGHASVRDPAPTASTAGTPSPGSAGILGAQGIPAFPTDSPGQPPGSPSGSTTLAALADGKSASYLKTVDTHARTVTFDLIELLMGDAATKEWLKTHPDEPDGPPEGYLIVNDNSRLRTLAFAVQASVKVVDLNASDPSVPKSIKLTDLPAHLAGERQAPLPYWLTVKNGQVTAVEEQYLA